MRTIRTNEEEAKVSELVDVTNAADGLYASHSRLSRSWQRKGMKEYLWRRKEYRQRQELQVHALPNGQPHH